MNNRQTNRAALLSTYEYDLHFRFAVAKYTQTPATIVHRTNERRIS